MAVSRAVHAAAGVWGRGWAGMVGGQETCLAAQRGAALLLPPAWEPELRYEGVICLEIQLTFT